jgi:hypothetical protein
VNVHRGSGFARDLGEKGAFLFVGFHKMHAEIRPPGLQQNGNDEPGKACP